MTYLGTHSNRLTDMLCGGVSVPRPRTPMPRMAQYCSAPWSASKYRAVPCTVVTKLPETELGATGPTMPAHPARNTTAINAARIRPPVSKSGTVARPDFSASVGTPPAFRRVGPARNRADGWAGALFGWPGCMPRMVAPFFRWPRESTCNTSSTYRHMQLTLDFSPGLTARYRSLKQVCAHAVYGSRAGLSGVAAALDMSPSELSKRLSETDSPDNRPLRDTDIERIITETGDASPIYWLVERYLGDPKAKQMQALAAIPELVAQLTALAEQAGVAIPASRKR